MIDWNAMSAAERADHLREAFKDMIDHQDSVFADIESRIDVLEEQMARLAKMIEAKF